MSKTIATENAPAAIGPYVNATYEAFFTEHNATFPARSCVEVARLPKDVKIEIEAIAVRR